MVTGKQGWVIKNKDGELPKGRQGKLYPTEKGARRGLRATVETLLQAEYLASDDLDYDHLLAWTGLFKDDEFHGANTTAEEIAAVQKRFDELAADWDIYEARIEYRS